MVDKLNALEKEREFLLDMCPKDKQDTYDAEKESTLVRILLKTLPKEYDGAIKECKSLLRFRRVSSMGQLDSISNLEDNVRMNYSEDWLPEYAELRHELLNEFYLQERRRKEEGKHHKGEHPVLPILQGHEQPGPEQRPCYGCGQRGDHLRGDPKCPAGLNGIWDGAPQIFKDRVLKKGAKGGKGKGKGMQRNLGKRKQGESSKTPCPNWSRGNDYCKFGPNCRNSHDGPKGGKPNEFKKRKNEVVFMATKKGKKARKRLSTLLIKDLKEGLEKSKEKAEGDEDEHLFRLIRGVPTVMISRGGEDSIDFKPLQPNSKSSVGPVNQIPIPVNQIPVTSKSRAWRNEPHVDFTVTLMMNSEETDDSSDEEQAVKEESSEPDSSSDDSESSGSEDSQETKVKSDSLSTDEKSGQSNFANSPVPLRKPSTTIKGILKSRTNKNVESGQSNFEKPNFAKFDLKDSDEDSESDEDEKILDEEKISHLKEQIFTWKYRTSCAEERVARLLQERERSIKASYERRRKKDPHYSNFTVRPLPERRGARARLSDTLDLLTEPKWETDPDPNVDWLVLKIPRGNKTFFMADFVDGDVEDEKEWLEGPFQQSATVPDGIETRRTKETAPEIDLPAI
jgi:hypothetical protein